MGRKTNIRRGNMTLERPIFLKWIIQEPDNWHLKENAPDWAKKEFERFMRELK